MALLWTYSEQQEIKPISANFPSDKFEEMANEIQVEDLQNLIGFDFYQDLIQNPTKTAYAELLDGGTYEYNSITYIFKGLKYVLAYLFFAKYIKHSGIEDTFGGFVKKNFEDSRETNQGEKKNYHNDFRKIAFKYWDECTCYMKANSSDFPYYYTDPLPRRCWNGDNYRNSYCF